MKIKKFLIYTLCLIVFLSLNITYVNASEVNENDSIIEEQINETEEPDEPESPEEPEEPENPSDPENSEEPDRAESLDEEETNTNEIVTDETEENTSDENKDIITENNNISLKTSYEVIVLNVLNEEIKEEDIITATTINIPLEVKLNEAFSFEISVPEDYILETLLINDVVYNYTELNENIYSFDDIVISDENLTKLNFTISLDISPDAINMIEESNTITTFSKELFADATGGPIIIDGHYGDWSDKPLSWHYNWNNSDNCWYWGCWYNGACYKTPEGTYDNNVRHLIQLYTDGEYVYVHIKIATIYESQFNGEDYNFYFNDERASFQITDENGQSITNNVNRYSPGIHSVQVRHRDGSCSYSLAAGSSGYLTVYDDYHNTDLEFKIPISECVYQNNRIDPDNIESIRFMTPNLMYTYIETHGTPTYAILLIIICVGIAGLFEFLYLKKKGRV